MSYQLYDENGFVADLATTKGLNDMLAYLRGLDIPGLNKLIQEGWDLIPEAILEELEEYVDPPAGEIKDTLDILKKNLKKCVGIVIFSDGLNDGLAALEEVE
jgi:hypothetical protein